MTDRERFLAAICAEPAEDLHRLVYADWLEDQGESDRAAFIRVQVELAPWESKSSSFEPPHLPALRRRERQLLKAHFGEWTDPLPEELVTKPCESCLEQSPDWETNAVECRRCDSTGLVLDEDRVEFRRGFVEELAPPAALWIEHGDAILKANPIREVRLATWPEVVVQTYERERCTVLTLTAGARQTSFYVEHRLIHHIGPDREGVFYRDIIYRLLKQLWPTVSFVLPEERPENVRVESSSS